MRNEQELKETFGHNVKIRRERMGLSQEGLAEKAGVTRNTINDIESGDKFARAATMVNLAKVLGTEVYELLKPKNVRPDKIADIIMDFGDKLRDAVGEIEKGYMKN